jgi:hypothetical protein
MRFYPFAELLDYDDFVFHPRHGHCMLVSPFYKKVNRCTYENMETGRSYTMTDRDLFSVAVSKVDTNIESLL